MSLFKKNKKNPATLKAALIWPHFTTSLRLQVSNLQKTLKASAASPSSGPSPAGAASNQDADQPAEPRDPASSQEPRQPGKKSSKVKGWVQHFIPRCPVNAAARTSEWSERLGRQGTELVSLYKKCKQVTRKAEKWRDLSLFFCFFFPFISVLLLFCRPLCACKFLKGFLMNLNLADNYRCTWKDLTSNTKVKPLIQCSQRVPRYFRAEGFVFFFLVFRKR